LANANETLAFKIRREDVTNIEAANCARPSGRPDIVESLEDDRFRELGKRQVAIERPDLLSEQQRSHWEAWRRDRLTANGDVPWFTNAAARTQIAELKQDSLAAQRQRLAEIERFLSSMAVCVHSSAE
jgi:exonuclease I